MNDQRRYYKVHELSRVSSAACKGCGECCRGMGDTIVLDPYDAYQLSYGLNKPFGGLIGESVELHVENGILLPHLAMTEKTESCAYLDKDGTCRIHAFRPGICRLYPLAREFREHEILYFLLPDPCPVSGRSKVRIDRYLGIPDIDQYESFKLLWHAFIKEMEALAVRVEDNNEELQKLSLFLLETFYLKPFDDEFYSVISRRIKRVRKYLQV